MHLKKIVLPGIILIAFFFRFWLVDSVPPSLYWDEVSQAYNAYSILKTGKDEHRELMPLARFQAFGDYKAPVYIYTMVPFLALFGKTVLAVRMPSALFGVLTVIITYFLSKELFDKFKYKDEISLLAALFLAVSPWHIQLSRAAYEGNLATFFTVLAIYLFVYAMNKKPNYLILSAISFVIGLYAFNAHRVFIPLLLFSLACLYFKKILSIKKTVVLSAFVGVILLIPFLLFLSTPESKLRFNEVNIFSDLRVIEESNKLTTYDNNDPLSRIIHNRRLLFAREYVTNYFDFFNPTYLFIKGDVNPRFSSNSTGQLYIWMLPLLVLGVYLIFISSSKSKYVILCWFILAPVAAATARETPHALRSATFIPLYEIIAAVGLVSLINYLYLFSKIITKLVILTISGVIIISIINFWHNYTVHFPREFSGDWQYGYQQAIAKTESLKDQYDQIIFSDVYGRPSIYVAWFGDYTPEDYWRKVQSSKDSYGFYNVSSLDKYIFVSDPIPAKGRALFVMPPDRVPSGVKIIDDIKFLNGESAFVIYEN